jgi:hypothetical protein
VGKNRSKNRRKKEKMKELKRKRKREEENVAEQREDPCEQSEGIKKPCLLPSPSTMRGIAPHNKSWTFAEFERQWVLGKL